MEKIILGVFFCLDLLSTFRIIISVLLAKFQLSYVLQNFFIFCLDLLSTFRIIISVLLTNFQLSYVFQNFLNIGSAVGIMFIILFVSGQGSSYKRYSRRKYERNSFGWKLKVLVLIFKSRM